MAEKNIFMFDSTGAARRTILYCLVFSTSEEKINEDMPPMKVDRVTHTL